MTVALAILGCAISALVSWVVCTHHHRALRLDRDFQEQDAWARADAAWQLSGEIEAIDVKRERWRDLAIKRIGGAS